MKTEVLLIRSEVVICKYLYTLVRTPPTSRTIYSLLMEARNQNLGFKFSSSLYSFDTFESKHGNLLLLKCIWQYGNSFKIVIKKTAESKQCSWIVTESLRYCFFFFSPPPVFVLKQKDKKNRPDKTPPVLKNTLYCSLEKSDIAAQSSVIWNQHIMRRWEK